MSTIIFGSLAPCTRPATYTANALIAVKELSPYHHQYNRRDRTDYKYITYDEVKQYPEATIYHVATDDILEISEIIITIKNLLKEPTQCVIEQIKFDYLGDLCELRAALEDVSFEGIELLYSPSAADGERPPKSYLNGKIGDPYVADGESDAAISNVRAMSIATLSWAGAHATEGYARNLELMKVLTDCGDYSSVPWDMVRTNELMYITPYRRIERSYSQTYDCDLNILNEFIVGLKALIPSTCDGVTVMGLEHPTFGITQNTIELAKKITDCIPNSYVVHEFADDEIPPQALQSAKALPIQTTVEDNKFIVVIHWNNPPQLKGHNRPYILLN